MIKNKHISVLLLLIIGFFGVATFAADLDQAKQSGLIGERADGFLGFVVEAPSADVVQLVNDINDRRKAEYQRIAADNGLTLEQVQVLAGKKAIERTKQGGWIMTPGGWRQK